ncbi:AraC family transcriptional regulator [Streptomyces sp. NPDC047981]|uniref:helix-turn-helix domain-containing protein n=1 Tax=Streptomyces sp. NPDC047981 TaxID=3154610 RepID=UPI00344742AE
MVHAPGLFGHHSLETGWRPDYPRGLSEHLLYFVVNGEYTATVGTERWTVDAGSVMWIRPRIAFTMSTPEDRRTVVYRFRLAADGETDACLEPAVLVPDVWEVRALFDQLVGELDSVLPFRAERIQGILLTLFTALFRKAEENAATGLLSASVRQTIEKFVDDHITGRPTVADLARVAGLSQDYFARTFRKTFGVPPREWLVRRRIQHAALHLDESDRSIAQVAVAYGYTDSFLFSRQFKSVMGVPPQTYRAR